MLYLSRFRNDENNVLNIILNFSESAGLMANEKPLLEAKYMYICTYVHMYMSQMLYAGQSA